MVRSHLRSTVVVVAGLGLALFAESRQSSAQEQIAATDEKLASASNQARIQQALDEKMSVDFIETPLIEVAKYFKDKLKIEILLDRTSLENAGTLADTPITLTAKNVSARSLLNLLLDANDLEYFEGDGMVVIATPEEASVQLQTRVYPVADLIATTNEFGDPIEDPDGLIDVIVSVTMESTWDEVGALGTISYFDGRLIVSQTENEQRTIAMLLEKLRYVRSADTSSSLPVCIPVDPREIANEVVRKSLEKTVSLDFVETPLADVASHFSGLLGINVLLDTRALNGAGIDSNTPITFQARSISAATALQFILDQADLTSMASNEVLLFTTPEALGAERIRYIYPVRDLMGAAVVRETAFESLLTTLKTNVQSTTWDHIGGPGAVVAAPMANAIIVWNHEKVQNDTKQLMEKLCATAPTTAKDSRAKLSNGLQTRIYQLPGPVQSNEIRGSKSAATRRQENMQETTPEEVAKLMRDLIEPHSWQDSDKLIRILGRKLIVRQPVSVHHRIERLLGRLGLSEDRVWMDGGFRAAEDSPSKQGGGGAF